MPPPKRIRALVLAAGEGLRLRPLTAIAPKPLLPIAGKPILAYTLDRLAELGCEAAAINLHHLGDDIRNTIGPRYRGMPLVYSAERELLGTLGALAPLRAFLQPARCVLIVNGDSLCAWPLRELIDLHVAHRARATVLLAAGPDVEPYGGGVGVDREGRVLGFRHAGPAVGRPVERHVFAGAHALDPALLERVEHRPSDTVRDLYEPMLVAGEDIRALITSAPWHDLGTHERYLAGATDWLRAAGLAVWQAPDATIDAGAALQGVMVESRAHIAKHARVRDSILLPGGSVGEGATVERCIVGWGVEVEAGAVICDQILALPTSTGASR